MSAVVSALVSEAEKGEMMLRLEGEQKVKKVWDLFLERCGENFALKAKDPEGKREVKTLVLIRVQGADKPEEYTMEVYVGRCKEVGVVVVEKF